LLKIIFESLPRALALKYDPTEKYLWFLPLGGTGEIGMKINLYRHNGQWLMIDCGVRFFTNHPWFPSPFSLLLLGKHSRLLLHQNQACFHQPLSTFLGIKGDATL
ncbi:MAG: hypothetical protein ACJAS1_004179, partial [Oleiphilaceae bacterium]